MSGRLRFLPWARAGISAAFPASASPADPVPARGRLTVTLVLGGDADGETVVKNVRTNGPGEVTVLGPGEIVGRFPAPDADGVETTGFAAVELDQPYAPWALTPAGPDPDGRLRPWLVLVVVPAATSTVARQDGRPLEVLTCPAAELPPPADSWAWAHVQLVGDDVDAALADPDLNSARLIAPRRLDDRTDYYAVLVPAFEAGRLSGLGRTVADLDASTLTDAWDPASPDPVELPVYDWWRFRTGVGGDFETLIRRLSMGPPPDEVGRRPMYIGAAGPEFPELPPEAPGAVLGLEGALRGPHSVPTPWPDAARLPWQREMRALLDTPELLTPPLYGAGHAGVAGLPAGDTWLTAVNLDPRHRAAAALGARVVQEHQEELAAGAWAQAAGLREANDLLRRGQLAAAAGGAQHRKRFTDAAPGRPFSAAELIAVTAPAHRAIALDDSGTVAARIAGNPGLAAVVDPAFRRLARPRGPLGRRFAADLDPPVAALADATLSTQPRLFVPAGAVALRRLSADGVFELRAITRAFVREAPAWWLPVPYEPLPPLADEPTQFLVAPGTFLLGDRFFATCADGRVFEVRYLRGRWTWRDHGLPPGGLARRPVTAVVDREAFVVTADGRVTSLAWDGDRWVWRDHGRPPGAAAVGAGATGPSVVVTCDNGHLAVLRPDGAGGRVWVDIGRTPSVPIVGPLPLVGVPAGAMEGTSIFVLSLPGWLWQLHVLGDGSYGWTLHGTPSGTTVAAVGSAMLNSKVFVTTADGRVFQRYRGANGWGWQDHGRPPGGDAADRPGAAAMDRKIFVRVSDGTLAELYWNDNAWVWVPHGRPPGVQLIAYPDAAVQAHDTFVTGDDGHLWSRAWTGAAYEWHDHGVPWDTGGQGRIGDPPAGDQRWAPRLGMFASLVVAHLDNPDGANRVFYRVGGDLGFDGVPRRPWDPQPLPGPATAPTGRGVGVAVADVTGNGTADLVVLEVEPADGTDCAGFYWLGTDAGPGGQPTGWRGPYRVHSPMNGRVSAADLAVADLDGDGRPELILGYAVDLPTGPVVYYRVGWCLNADGEVTQGWTESRLVPAPPGRVRAIGVDVADMDDDDRPDLVVLTVSETAAGDRADYLIGRQLNRRGVVVGGWGPSRPVGGGPIAARHQGAGVAIADFTGSRRPDLVVFLLADEATENQGRYRIGFDLAADGTARSWSEDHTVPGWFGWENQGASVTVADLDPALTGVRTTMGNAFTAAAEAHQDYLAPAQELARAARVSEVAVPQTVAGTVRALDPRQSVSAYVRERVTVDGDALPAVPPGAEESDPGTDGLRPLLRAISFPQPAYEMLRRLAQEHVLPGAERIPPDTMTLLRANPAFIEAFLVGLNTELSRELLWREFPGDLRTTWFRRFWDVRGAVTATPDDIPPIDRWTAPLGRNATGVGAGGEGNLVLAVRGELLRRYPSVAVTMRRAGWADDDHTRHVLAAEELPPTFSSWLSPDLAIFGFPRTVAEARGDGDDPGWFMVLREQPGTARFGVDDPPSDESTWETPPETWNELHWAHLTGRAHVTDTRFLPVSTGPAVGLELAGARYPRNGAHVARALLQRPNMIAVHAGRMLPPLDDGWRVTGKQTGEPDVPARRIARLVGEHADGAAWSWDAAQVVAAVAHGDHFHFPLDDGRTARVVVTGTTEEPVLATDADEPGADRLMLLPEVTP